VGTGDWGCPVWEWGGRKRNGPISVISDLIKKIDLNLKWSKRYLPELKKFQIKIKEALVFKIQ
jgi:hypothetical protein